MKFKQKISAFILLVSWALVGYSQPEGLDQNLFLNEEEPTDSSLVSEKNPSEAAIDAPINYDSKDSMAFSFENGQQIVHLYGGATIKYGSINLAADYISMNFEQKEIYASVLRDSLGNINNKTKFSEGGEEFECETLRYNFVTGKGFVENVVTEQEDGLVRSTKAKMMNKDVYCMVDGKYSTCTADHPHFYLQITKGKVLREKAIITGRSYLVLEDFPIYFPFLPYGYIPTYKKTYSSGVIIPSYGEDRQNYGFYLRDGGFYWAASEYFDLRITGDIYSKGRWAVNARTGYRVRYKFLGNFGFSYSNSVTGERGINQKVSPSFSVRWSHSQDAKANPSQSFSASVDYSSSGFSKDNEFTDPDRFLQNSTSSSITYNKDILNTPFNMSASMRISQNTLDSTVSLTLPSIYINMKSIYPFRKKNKVGKKGILDDFQFKYSTQYTSQINTKESMFLSTPYSEWDKSIKHNIPITLPSFRLFKHINVVPSIGYNERWFFEYMEKYWMDGYYVTDNETGLEKWVSGHVEEVTRDKFRRNYDFNGSISASTTLYGLYNMINPNWKIKSIRHKIDPSISFSYRPDFSNSFFGFYDWVQIDSLGNLQQYNMFPSGSAPSGRNGSIRFGLNNNIEMKVDNSQDTTSTVAFKKIAIFDNLGFSGSYNLIAEEFNMSVVNINMRTKIAGTVININGVLDPYALDERGQRISEYNWVHATGLAKLGRLTNASTGYSFSYGSDKLKKTMEQKKKDKGEENKGPNALPSGYEEFDLPWRVSLSYNFNYSNPDGKPRITQSLSLTGNIDITPKWKTTFSSGFDFMAMKLTHTKMSVIRDLHCWTMSFDFSPVSSRPYYMFTIRANASMLKDLKVERSNY